MTFSSKRSLIDAKRGRQHVLARSRRTAQRQPFSPVFILVLILSIFSTIGFFGLLAVAVAGG